MKVTRTGRIIVAGALILSGCAAPGSTTVPQMTQVNYYPQCYQSVGLLRQQDQQFQQVMAVNTLAGAARKVAPRKGGLCRLSYMGKCLVPVRGRRSPQTGTCATLERYSSKAG